MDRIASWETAGLIDPATASRLRLAESAEADTDATNAAAGAGRRGTPSWLGSMFGPGIVIPELFGYIGAAFVLAAWHTLASSFFVPATTIAPAPAEGSIGPELVSPNLLGLGIEWIVPAVILTAIGVLLLRRSEREQRAGGVALAAATIHVFIASTVLVDGSLDQNVRLLIAAVAAAVVALAFRVYRPAMVTHANVLGAAVVLAIALFGWLGDQLFDDGGGYGSGQPAKAILTSVWWLAWSVAFGLAGLLEWRAASAPGELASPLRLAAANRANLSRLVAGATAVLGTALAVTQFGPEARAIEPLLADGFLLIVSGVLLALAVRGGAGAYLYPAALGAIIAFSDLNSQYVAAQTGAGVALLVEGLILIGGGLLADRLRRRLAHPGPMPA